MKILYFTGSGNCLSVAKAFGGATILSIPQLIKKNEYNVESDIVGFVCPIYGFDAPKIVKEFIRRCTLQSEYTFLIGTYGARTGRFGTRMQKYFFDNGKKIDYINSVIMVDNFLPGFEQQKQIDTLEKKQVQKHIDTIVQDIKNKKEFVQKNANKILDTAVQKIFSKMLESHNATKTFTINNDCSKCQTCIKVCPRNNISLNQITTILIGEKNASDGVSEGTAIKNDDIKNRKITFGNNCEMCFACAHACPSHAIKVKHQKSDVRYRNSSITLQEIIDANCQL